MGRNYDYSLTEEQMAAYLDGMLNAEQSNMVEEIISSDFDMQQIEDALDAVDSTFIAINSEEVPLECLADDFILPEITILEDNIQVHDDIMHDDHISYDEEDNGFDFHDNHANDDVDTSNDDGIYDDSYETLF